MALVSNVLRQLVHSYEMGNNEHTGEQLIDLVELNFINKSISKYEFEDLLGRIERKAKELHPEEY